MKTEYKKKLPETYTDETAGRKVRSELKDALKRLQGAWATIEAVDEVKDRFPSFPAISKAEQREVNEYFNQNISNAKLLPLPATEREKVVIEWETLQAHVNASADTIRAIVEAYPTAKYVGKTSSTLSVANIDTLEKKASVVDVDAKRAQQIYKYLLVFQEVDKNFQKELHELGCYPLSLHKAVELFPTTEAFIRAFLSGAFNPMPEQKDEPHTFRVGLNNEY